MPEPQTITDDDITLIALMGDAGLVDEDKVITRFRRGETIETAVDNSTTGRLKGDYRRFRQEWKRFPQTAQAFGRLVRDNPQQVPGLLVQGTLLAGKQLLTDAGEMPIQSLSDVLLFATLALGGIGVAGKVGQAVTSTGRTARTVGRLGAVGRGVQAAGGAAETLSIIAGRIPQAAVTAAGIASTVTDPNDPLGVITLPLSFLHLLNVRRTKAGRDTIAATDETVATGPAAQAPTTIPGTNQPDVTPGPGVPPTSGVSQIVPSPLADATRLAREARRSGIERITPEQRQDAQSIRETGDDMAGRFAAEGDQVMPELIDANVIRPLNTVLDENSPISRELADDIIAQADESLTSYRQGTTPEETALTEGRLAEPGEVSTELDELFGDTDIPQRADPEAARAYADSVSDIQTIHDRGHTIRGNEQDGYTVTRPDSPISDARTLDDAKHAVDSILETEGVLIRDGLVRIHEIPLDRYIGIDPTNTVGRLAEHKASVISALERGDPIPDVVIRDYPELNPETPRLSEFGVVDEGNARDAIETAREDITGRTETDGTDSDVVKEQIAQRIQQAASELSPSTPVTREAFRELIEQRFRVTPEQATAVSEITDARARAWAETEGRTPEEWYTSRIANIGRDPSLPGKGTVEYISDGRAAITALSESDVTTAIHEMGHIFRRDLVSDDLRTIEIWSGAKDGKWTVPSEEKFARGFERYIADGVAPNTKLGLVFEKLKRWMLDVYKSIRGSEIGIGITPEVRSVFDRLLSNRGPEGMKVTDAQKLNDANLLNSGYQIRENIAADLGLISPDVPPKLLKQNAPTKLMQVSSTRATQNDTISPTRSEIRAVGITGVEGYTLREGLDAKWKDMRNVIAANLTSGLRFLKGLGDTGELARIKIETSIAGYRRNYARATIRAEQPMIKAKKAIINKEFKRLRATDPTVRKDVVARNLNKEVDDSLRHGTPVRPELQEYRDFMMSKWQPVQREIFELGSALEKQMVELGQRRGVPTLGFNSFDPDTGSAISWTDHAKRLMDEADAKGGVYIPQMGNKDALTLGLGQFDDIDAKAQLELMIQYNYTPQEMKFGNIEMQRTSGAGAYEVDPEFWLPRYLENTYKRFSEVAMYGQRNELLHRDFIKPIHDHSVSLHDTSIRSLREQLGIISRASGREAAQFENITKINTITFNEQFIRAVQDWEGNNIPPDLLRDIPANELRYLMDNNHMVQNIEGFQITPKGIRDITEWQTRAMGRANRFKQVAIDLHNWRRTDPNLDAESEFWNKLGTLTTVTMMSPLSTIVNLSEIGLLSTKVGVKATTKAISDFVLDPDVRAMGPMAGTMFTDAVDFMSNGVALDRKYLGGIGFTGAEKVVRSIGAHAGWHAATNELGNLMRGAKNATTRLDELNFDWKRGQQILVENNVTPDQLPDLFAELKKGVVQGSSWVGVKGEGGGTSTLLSVGAKEAWKNELGEMLIQSGQFVAQEVFKPYNSLTLPAAFGRHHPLVRVVLKFKGWMLQNNRYWLEMIQHSAERAKVGDLTPASRMLTGLIPLGLAGWASSALVDKLTGKEREGNRVIHALSVVSAFGMLGELLRISEAADGNAAAAERMVTSMFSAPLASTVGTVTGGIISLQPERSAEQLAGRIPAVGPFVRNRLGENEEQRSLRRPVRERIR